MSLPTSYSARPDGKMTLYDVINMIPEGERIHIEDAINNLVEGEGFGEIVLVVVKGKLVAWKLQESRKIKFTKI